MQGVYWLLTVPQHCFVPYLPNGVKYLRGQLERGNTTGFLHWQLMVVFSRSVRLAAVKSTFGDECHAELSRSEATSQYVWKDETSVPTTRFELGRKPIKRNNASDWGEVVMHAKLGRFDDIPADILVRHYTSIKRIYQDNLVPIGLERQAIVYWGATGTGKSRRAWETWPDSYPKDPRNKWWDGYKGEESVIVDEFRGDIGINSLLRWCDRYPVLVETKGSSTTLKAKTIIFTSNLHPKNWYPDIDNETYLALKRRLKIFNVIDFFNKIQED